jgi:glycosyltransferase involved in cell wall biosynthesis
MRVLYFTVVPLGTSGNGGSICCRNHVIRLAADPDIELIAMVAGPAEQEAATKAFFAEAGVKSYFQPFRNDNLHPATDTVAAIACFATKVVFQFPWELQAMNQPHIQEGIDWAVKGYSIDFLVIDYHPSALFLKLPRKDVRTALIKLNREGDFYEDMIRMGKTKHGRRTARISLLRARRFERITDAKVGKIITIGPPDLPNYRLPSRPVCISPYLDPRTERWSYTASNTLLFIGDVHHYPNWLAVEWIATKLAPALRAVRSNVHISVVGALASQVPSHWDQPNMLFLGRSTNEAVKKLFLTADMMLCPIENNYGVKFKSLEAIAYGIPLIASRQTLLGLPYLPEEPAIDLQDVASAASTICALLANPTALIRLAALQRELQDAFIADQRTVWSRSLRDIPLPNALGRCRWQQRT